MKPISSICLLLFLTSHALPKVGGLPSRTMNETEMTRFCKSKNPEEKRGYGHPYYCSKAIFCSYQTSDGQDKILSQEFTCPQCSINPARSKTGENDCTFGYEHWDEGKQTCRRTSQVSCRQEELPKVKSWGRADLAPYCGTTKDAYSYATHPYHCGKFLYCERDKLYRDLYVEVRYCPKCDQHATKCPQGYEYHTSGGICTAPGNIKNDDGKCRPQEILKTTPASFSPGVPKSPLNDLVAIPQGANQTQLSVRFCQNVTEEPGRHPHPQNCHKYIFCWYGLYDEDGDLRDKKDAVHLEFSCTTCDFDEIKCPLGFKVYDPMSMECRSSDVVSCNSGIRKAVSFNSREQERHSVSRKPLLNGSEVTEFCMGKRGNRSQDYAHPIDKSCTMYITCWFQQNYFMEKSCDQCDKGPQCPLGFLHFDEKSQDCRNATNSTCNPERTVPTPLTLTPAPAQMTPAQVTPANLPKGDNSSGLVETSTSKDETSNEPKQRGPATSDILLKARACRAKDYIQRGYCKTYFKCNRKKRFEDMHSCSGRLFWNPDRNSIHGGVCDYLKNIDNFTLYQYKKDPGCVLNVAYFRADDKACSGIYFYNHPRRTQGREMRLECPEDLLWTKERKTCAKCGDVTKPTGGLCCDSDSDYDSGALLSTLHLDQLS